ncbi:MAG: triose-phosphate isomerase [Cyclobacteriaceae bacterium]
MRQQIVAGNWKMNNSLLESQTLASEVVNMVADEYSGEAKVVLCPTFTFLSHVLSLTKNSDKVDVGAQNCHENDSGAFTGEVSANMLKSLGVNYVIIGHSERREYFGESDGLLGEKVSKVFENGLIPIFCCGESLEVRESGKHIEHVKDQLSNSLFHLSEKNFQKLVIAYEPIWAIGTGKTASSDQAQEMHKELRQHLMSKFGELAYEVPILYGGSVKPANAKEIFGQPDVDGGLVGGASLKSRDFVDIVKAI